MVTINSLLFFFMAAFILACMLVLFFNAGSSRVRLWYGFFILSFIAWSGRANGFAKAACGCTPGTG